MLLNLRAIRAEDLIFLESRQDQWNLKLIFSIILPRFEEIFRKLV